MSIATVGPKKYDFQDLVCLDFILNNIDERDINFLIEPDGKEDAFFSYTDVAQKTKSIEVQVKGSENHVTLNFVAECLLHFPDRRAQGCLFDRMVEDENLYIVLVMTGRATDSLLKFIPKGEWRNTQHQDKITISDAESIKLEFHNLVQSIRADTQLAKKRKAHIQQIIDNYDSKQAKTYLRRLIIVDGESESDVKAKMILDSLSHNESLTLMKVTNDILDTIPPNPTLQTPSQNHNFLLRVETATFTIFTASLNTLLSKYTIESVTLSAYFIISSVV
ncbi:hypothetical protein M2G38_16965 [Vibrio vulnificus]|nr:hypothetical protein [Vibrio vulnificus]